MPKTPSEKLNDEVKNPSSYADQHGNSSLSHFEEEESDINIRELFYTLIRRKAVIITSIAVSVVLMTVFLLVQTPLYTAKTTMQINVNAEKVVDFESVVSGVSADEPAIQSEIDVIKSRHLAAAVIKKLNLLADKEFNQDADSASFTWLSDVLPFTEETHEEKEERKRIALTKTIDEFLENIKVNRKQRSYTVFVSFSSNDPKKSALIANTIVEEYLLNQLSNKFNATKRANDWLNKKISDLQQNLQQSEMAVQMFKEQNNLIETAGMTVNDQQLSELNTQLILSRTGSVQASARLKSAQQSIESSSEVLNSKLIQSLRGQEAEVLRKKSDLSNRYGKRHPKMINVNAELRDLRDKIKSEIAKIKIGLKKEVEIAKAREESLEKSLMQLEGKAGSSTKAKVQLSELTRQRDANRSLYESFLTRSKETFHNQDLAQSDANILSEAEIPLKPSYPRKKIMLLISIIFGSVIGVILAFLMEHLDNAFKNSNQLEKITGIASIGIVPELDQRTNFVSYVTTKISSTFVESLRSILTSIHFSNPDNIPKSILVTSSVPDEGKTTFSVSFASMIAKSGQKVLLLDCDLKKPSVARKFGVKDVKYGLGDYLTGEATEKQVINFDKKSGLHFISSHPDTSNSQDLLASNKMKEFIEQMTKKYDLVILDSPPIMAVSDAIVVAKIVDTVVYVVRWDKTPRQIVKNSLKQLKYSNIRLAGTILTHVNLDKLSKYDYGSQGYYYKNYKDYYTSS